MTTQDEDVVREGGHEHCQSLEREYRGIIADLRGQVATLTDLVRDVAVVDWMDKNALEALAERADAALAQHPEQDKETAGTLSNAESKKSIALTEPAMCPNDDCAVEGGEARYYRADGTPCTWPGHAEVTTPEPLCRRCRSPEIAHPENTSDFPPGVCWEYVAEATTIPGENR